MGHRDAVWARAVAVLADATDVALACHVDPDGDALGSMLALSAFLRRRGVRTTASFATSDPAAAGRLVVPPQYTFVPGLDHLVAPVDFPAAPEILVVLDCAASYRLGALEPSAVAASTAIVLDHHAEGREFGDVRVVESGAAATAVLVDELITRCGGTLDRDMATCLYVALVTDTGRFSHACTTPEVMDFAARLLGHGIDACGINRQVWDTHSWGYLKVLGRALERARFEPGTGLAWTVVRQADLDECGIAAAETESFIDVLRGFEAAACTMVCKEQVAPGDDPGAPPRWKVSLRSRGVVDVGRISACLGGGGHAFAAGFNAEGPLEAVVGRVTALLEAAPVPVGAGAR